jgi:hypoxanthine phosphoribosyltransferase
MRDITYIDLVDFNCNVLEQVISHLDETKKIVLVAIPRGGLHLTQCISYGILYDRIILAKDSKDILNTLDGDLSKYQILVCDDIYDSGKRYQAFDKIWEYPQNKMCVQIARYRSSLPSNVLCGSTAEHDEYVVFPWEQKDLPGECEV